MEMPPNWVEVKSTGYGSAPVSGVSANDDTTGAASGRDDLQGNSRVWLEGMGRRFGISAGGNGSFAHGQQTHSWLNSRLKGLAARHDAIDEGRLVR
jgi:hypothetical protein